MGPNVNNHMPAIHDGNLNEIQVSSPPGSDFMSFIRFVFVYKMIGLFASDFVLFRSILLYLTTLTKEGTHI